MIMTLFKIRNHISSNQPIAILWRNEWPLLVSYNSPPAPQESSGMIGGKTNDNQKRSFWADSNYFPVESLSGSFELSAPRDFEFYIHRAHIYCLIFRVAVIGIGRRCLVFTTTKLLSMMLHTWKWNIGNVRPWIHHSSESGLLPFINGPVLVQSFTYIEVWRQRSLG